MNPDPSLRRLKRGLKDVSPLFRSEAPEPEQELPRVSHPRVELSVERKFQCLSIYSPDMVGDTLFLSTFVASHLASVAHACTIVSLDVPMGHSPESPRHEEILATNLRRLVLPWSQFETVWQRPMPIFHGEHEAEALFLDFEYARVPCFEKVIPILDKMILLMKPNYESLSETYKMIKATLSLNPRLEYYLLVDVAPEDERGAVLFERFAELAARRLGVDLLWLGNLHFRKSSREPFVSRLMLEHLFMRPSRNVMDSVEKRVLAEVAEHYQDAAHLVLR